MELEPEDFFIKEKTVPHENLKVAIGMLILAIYSIVLAKLLGGFEVRLKCGYTGIRQASSQTFPQKKQQGQTIVSRNQNKKASQKTLQQKLAQIRNSPYTGLSFY